VSLGERASGPPAPAGPPLAPTPPASAPTLPAGPGPSPVPAGRAPGTAASLLVTSGLSVRAVVIAVVVLLAACAVGLAVGPTVIPLTGILRDIASRLPWLGVRSHLSFAQSAILWQVRAPRVTLGVLVGGTLALSGSSYQGTFRNPLADPYLLGVAAGAGLGATLAIVHLSHGGLSTPDLVPVCAFVGALLAVGLTYLVAGRGAIRGSASLLLAGVAVAALFTAVQTFLQQQSASTVNQVYVWLLGSLNTATWHDVILVVPYCAAGTVVMLMHGRLLDVLSLGDLEAASLGVHVGRVRFTVIAAASLATAAVVSVSGLIGFVGIIVPHAVRMVAGTSYRIVGPLSLLAGGAFLVLCDVVANIALSPAQVPIGVVTAIIGGPFFIVVLRARFVRAGA
jgi:iron complex transport system permease protein